MSKMATQIVHWPGKDTPACDEHARQLKRLGEILMGYVGTTPATKEIACANCENEDKKGPR
jgi:hypothetical protein